MGKPFRKVRHTLAYLMVKIGITTILIIPRTIGVRLFSLLGLLSKYLLIPYNRIILENLNSIYGNTKTSKEIKKIRDGVFRNIGITLFDAVKLPSYNRDKFLKIVTFDIDRIKEVYEQEQKGIILLGAHSSCFEVQPHIFAFHNFPIFVVGTNLFDKRIDDIVASLRSRNGVKYIPRDGAGRAIIKELRSGGLFGALIDQDATNDGVFAHFLGKLAFTPTGPIRLGVKFELPIFAFFLSRDKNYNYHLNISSRISIDSDKSNVENIVKIAEEANNYISDMIDKYPEQWVWMHKRWRRKREELPNIPSITDF